MIENQPCCICGRKEYVSGVYDTRTDQFWCKECFDKHEWPKIQDEANRRALPAKIFFGLSLLFLFLVILKIIVFILQ